MQAVCHLVRSRLTKQSKNVPLRVHQLASQFQHPKFAVSCHQSQMQAVCHLVRSRLTKQSQNVPLRVHKLTSQFQHPKFAVSCPESQMQAVFHLVRSRLTKQRKNVPLRGFTNWLPSSNIPNLQCLVMRARCKQFAIW